MFLPRLVYAAEDELFEPAFQRFIAEQLLGIEPVELQAGHFPMVEDPGRRCGAA